MKGSEKVRDVYEIRPADIILSIAVVIAAVAMYIFLFAPESAAEGEKATVIVTIDGSEYGRYPLDEDRSVDIKTDSGFNRLEIKDGKAIMADADCPDGYCISHGGISRKGEVIVCLPHKLSVEIETSGKNSKNSASAAGSNDEIDAVVR